MTDTPAPSPRTGCARPVPAAAGAGRHALAARVGRRGARGGRPRVIEEALYEHPAVLEACVIGTPDEYRGQSPKAFVALKPGAAPFTLEELKAFLGQRLSKHEMVQALEIRDSLPKTAVGKLSKKELVDQEAAAPTTA